MIPNLKRLDDHIIENTDTKAHSQYVAQRNMANKIRSLEQQINILMKRLSDLEKKVK
jgi:hypothetical protein